MFGKSYVLGAWVMALLKIFWGIERLQNPGKIFYGNWSLESMMMPIDLLWNLVSLLAIFLFVEGKKPWLSPLSFIAYSLIMTLLVGVIPSLATLAEASAHLPTSFLHTISVVSTADGVVGILFGIYYAIINVWLWGTLITENKS